MMIVNAVEAVRTRAFPGVPRRSPAFPGVPRRLPVDPRRFSRQEVRTVVAGVGDWSFRAG